MIVVKSSLKSIDPHNQQQMVVKRKIEKKTAVGFVLVGEGGVLWIWRNLGK